MKLKIGIFDSGIGGFTILGPLLKKRKDLEVFYLADTKRVPYGDKDFRTVNPPIPLSNIPILSFTIS